MEQYEKALEEILTRIAEKIPEQHQAYPVKAYITGGAAVYLYTEVRVSDDLDLMINRRIEDFPKDLHVIWMEEGEKRKLYYDYTYTSSLGLMHEDYDQRANLYKIIDKKFEIYILHPIDLIISKILRFESNDEEDIEALGRRFHLKRKDVESLANDAINTGVGFRDETARQHLEWALEILDGLEKK